MDKERFESLLTTILASLLATFTLTHANHLSGAPFVTGMTGTHAHSYYPTATGGTAASTGLPYPTGALEARQLPHISGDLEARHGVLRTMPRIPIPATPGSLPTTMRTVVLAEGAYYASVVGPAV
ncbi:MAG: hypothetical protein Q9169_005418 [Polycauliona sp. 2 TL-2023]